MEALVLDVFSLQSYLFNKILSPIFELEVRKAINVFDSSVPCNNA